MVSSERSLKVQATIWVAVRGGGGLPEGRTCRVTPEGRWVACHFGRFSFVSFSTTSRLTRVTPEKPVRAQPLALHQSLVRAQMDRGR